MGEKKGLGGVGLCGRGGGEEREGWGSVGRDEGEGEVVGG